MKKILKIVIADDNEVMVESLKKWLDRQKNYQVVGVAPDGKSEIKLIEELAPDLVITDIKKPDGWIGLDIVRKYKEKQKSPIFFVISAGIEEYVTRLEKLDIKYYLEKPCFYGDIYKTIHKIYDENFLFPVQRYLKKFFEVSIDDLLLK